MCITVTACNIYDSNFPSPLRRDDIKRTCSNKRTRFTHMNHTHVGVFFVCVSYTENTPYKYTVRKYTDVCVGGHQSCFYYTS